MQPKDYEELAKEADEAAEKASNPATKQAYQISLLTGEP